MQHLKQLEELRIRDYKSWLISLYGKTATHLSLILLFCLPRVLEISLQAYNYKSVTLTTLTNVLKAEYHDTYDV